tara:strand:- start:53 stop:643 length:591 start_codon:yes stop_codon:yes gene_type:complete
MYYPQSKILTNQYTDGTELVYESTKQYYVGAYHILSNGNIFTGKNPRDGELKKLEFKEPILYNNANDSDEFTQLSLNPTNTTYDGIRKRQNIKPPNAELIEPKYSEPAISYPSFKRYFLRRTNNVIFTEVSQIDFNAIKIKDPKYNFGIYIPFELIWTTSGANIAETNEKMTFLTEKRFKVYGLSKYITNYTEFSA